MKYLRQSTASTVVVGPFCSITTALSNTGLSDQSANGRLVKNGTGGTITASSSAHDAQGHYLVGLSTGHTDTVGRLRLEFYDAATYLPVWEDFSVLSAAVYDVLFGTVAPSTHTAAAVQTLVAAGTVTTVTGNVNGSLLGNVGGNIVGSVASVVGAVGSVTAAVTVSGTVTLAAATHTGAVIPTVTTLTGHTPQTGDSYARIGATGSGLTSLASQASVTTLAGYVDTEVAAIKAKTDQLTFTVTNSVDATATASLGSNAPAGWINAAAIASDAITAAKVAADVAAEISAKVWVDMPAGTPVEDIAEGVWEYATRTLTAAGLDSIVVETGINARQALAIIGATTAGKASGLATSTVTCYAMGAAGTSTTRAVYTCDADGNRSASTLTIPT